jgi:hypothetical protein
LQSGIPKSFFFKAFILNDWLSHYKSFPVIIKQERFFIKKLRISKNIPNYFITKIARKMSGSMDRKVEDQKMPGTWITFCGFP